MITLFSSCLLPYTPRLLCFFHVHGLLLILQRMGFAALFEDYPGNLQWPIEVYLV